MASTACAECPQSHWVPDGERLNCSLCDMEFGLWTRRHHCRKCGDVFCAACTAYSLPMRCTGHATSFSLESKDLVLRRVCSRCLHTPVPVLAPSSSQPLTLHPCAPAAAVEHEAATAVPAGEFGEVFRSHAMTAEQQAACHELRLRLLVTHSSPTTAAATTAEMIGRFLRATNFERRPEVDEKGGATRPPFAAEGMLRRHLEWRDRWQPHAIKSAEVQVAMDTGVCRFLGVGRQGHPIVWGAINLLI